MTAHDHWTPLVDLEGKKAFVGRHIGPPESEKAQMLAALGLTSMEELIDATVPEDIRMTEPLDLPSGVGQTTAQNLLRAIARSNQIRTSLIGMGYHETITPPVIRRNILENPGWYTAYTPYQPEISQGRLEALLNFQTMVAELTGMDLANASLLDEATAVAEAMTMPHRVNRKKTGDTFLIDAECHPQTIAVTETRAEPIGLSTIVGDPASAVMAGMRVLVVNCDDEGNVEIAHLDKLVSEHRRELAALMISYPSTHGVFEVEVRRICEMVHDAGGQVYLDGANLNAMVGLAQPGKFGADVSHLNLHKTFCIPHGGGGPGIGPIGVGEHLVPFLPNHPLTPVAGPPTSPGPVAAAPWGSAGILAIPWMYIRMMGAKGLRQATETAILNANYIAKRLEDYYPVLYRGANGWVAHECILDTRIICDEASLRVDDIAKRLIDFGFHAPTMSFPVPETLMVEPTESESLAELDRFCDAMIAIHGEAKRVASGDWPVDNNPLVNAPHTASDVTADSWPHPYSRSEAAFPEGWGRADKYWPPVSRIDGVYGDRNLMCSCPPMELLSE